MDPETSDAEIMTATLEEGVRYLPEGTFTERTQENSDCLISMNLAPDENSADEALGSLVNNNPWLIMYPVDGATEVIDPNGDIAVIIENEDPTEESVGTDDTPSNPGKGKKK